MEFNSAFKWLNEGVRTKIHHENNKEIVEESRLIWGGFFLKLLLNLGKRSKTFQNTRITQFD